jgi:hypothetical protein
MKKNTIQKLFNNYKDKKKDYAEEENILNTLRKKFYNQLNNYTNDFVAEYLNIFY